MKSTKLGDFVRKRKYLFWSTKNYDGLDAAAVLEGVLNYGDMDDVRELLKLIGIKEAAKIFYRDTHRTRVNYRPEIVNYFQLYFNRYAH